MQNFARIDRLPPYVLAVIDELKLQARRAGEDIIDFGMGNPDNPAPQGVVDKLCEAVNKPHNHRYSSSRGITKLRLAIANYYQRRFGVELDHETEIVSTIGVKEGFSHLMWAIVNPGDLVVVPTPYCPIHMDGPVFPNGDILHGPLETNSTEDFLSQLR